MSQSTQNAHSPLEDQTISAERDIKKPALMPSREPTPQPMSTSSDIPGLEVGRTPSESQTIEEMDQSLPEVRNGSTIYGIYKTESDPASLKSPLKPEKEQRLALQPNFGPQTGFLIDAHSTKDLPATPPPPPPTAKESLFLDPTPKTPQLSRLPSLRTTSFDASNEKDTSHGRESPSKAEYDEKGPVESGLPPDQESQSEIQSIIEQFTDETGAFAQGQIMSPRLELASPKLGAGQFPPRKSSLEPLRPMGSGATGESDQGNDSFRNLSSPPPVPPKPDQTPLKGPAIQPLTPTTSAPLAGPPPPPEPEPDQPFDFHRFLEQLRHKSADPVAKFLRSFLTEFGKKQWMVHEQVKIIGDFLAFIANKMALCDVWRAISDTEYDNAKEGMEKLVMNRLYAQTFSPAIPAPPQPPRTRGKRNDQDKVQGPGRRGQHQEDVERDEILAQKVRIYGWVKEEHLDIPPVGLNGQRFLKLAQQELLKIKGYRAPRDKVICVLNCCKVIFGLLKNAGTADTSADSFVPLLIYVVLQANVEHLVSNIQYILRFRNQDKLGGEAGYYLSSLSGAIQFIEGLDRTSLTVSDEDFEHNVELAVSAIAEKNREAEMAHSPGQYVSEKSRPAEPEVTPRNSMDATYSSPGKSAKNGTSSGNTVEESEENAAVAGLLRTIQRPLSTIGRIFSDDGGAQSNRSGPATTPQPGSTPRLSPSVFQIPRKSGEQQRPDDGLRQAISGAGPASTVQNFDAQESAARQASAEAAEARRIQRAEHKNVVETLYGMFPNLDKDVIDDVVRMKEGRVGLAVDACLALTAGG